MDDEIKELRQNADKILELLKTNPANYRALYNKYISITAKIRYRTNPAVREYKRDYYNKQLIKKFQNSIAV